MPQPPRPRVPSPAAAVTVAVVLTIALPIWSPPPAGAETPPRQQRFTQAGEEVRWSWQPAAGQSVEVSVIYGDIRVAPAEGSRVELVARRREPGGGGPLDVLFLPAAGGLTVCTAHPDAPRRADAGQRCAYGREREIEGAPNRTRVDFEVRLPPTLTLRARTVNGEVEVDSFHGSLFAASVTGRVVLNDAEGAVAVRTVSGDVELRDVRADQLDVETVSGAVLWSGGRPQGGGEYRIRSYSGDVRLSPAAGSDVTVVLTSDTGRLRSDLDVYDQGRDDQQRRHQSATLGAGTARVEVSTYSGDAELIKPRS